MRTKISFLSNYFRSSIRRKFSLVFLLLSSMILIVYMGITIFLYRTEMTESSIHSLFQEMSLVRNNIDNMLDYVENLSVLVLTDTEIQQGLQKTSIQSADVLQVSNRMTDIISKFNIVDGAVLCDLRGNLYDSGVVVAEQNLFDQMSSSPGWNFVSLAPYYSPVIYGQRRPSVVSFTRAINSYETGRRMGYLSLYVQESTLQSVYKSHVSTIQETQLISSELFNEMTKEHEVHPLSETLSESEGSSSGYLSTDDHLILFEYYEPLCCYLIGKLDSSFIENVIRKVVLSMGGTGLLLIFVCLLVSMSLSGHMTQNILNLLEGVRKIQNGDWEYRFENRSKDEIGILAEGINDMVTTIHETTNSLVEEQKNKRKYQLEMLNQQINPHFLYNTLDNICALAELGEPEQVVMLTSNLARFYRGALSKGSLVVPLEEERKTAASYLNIMKTRYYGTFDYQIDIPEEYQRNTMLRLILQPVLENAVSHGFEGHEPGGMIHVTAEPGSQNELFIRVCDNGKGMDPSQIEHIYEQETSSGKGGYALKNVQARIRLYYGNEYGITIKSKPGKGTTVIIRVPRRDI